MPLYKCAECGCIENTALSNFWYDHIHEGKPALCSECDPVIAKWHGHFTKRLATDADTPNLYGFRPCDQSKEESN